MRGGCSPGGLLAALIDHPTRKPVIPRRRDPAPVVSRAQARVISILCASMQPLSSDSR
ncbi:hypothetical protein GXW71_22160 [Roseomonas hellenica]|uniref:Transposase n=1 Tax=Plastoroseomonas hellenica TaxID=2687306 RepID=A0ABS5F3F0_9PROT|nr:hypothetical protein [Plastoroseomonas hellenica]MBR0667082.1 hypothetical protein [Plastoroseomonas hellenica]